MSIPEARDPPDVRRERRDRPRPLSGRAAGAWSVDPFPRKPGAVFDYRRRQRRRTSPFAGAGKRLNETASAEIRPRACIAWRVVVRARLKAPPFAPRTAVQGADVRCVRSHRHFDRRHGRRSRPGRGRARASPWRPRAWAPACASCCTATDARSRPSWPSARRPRRVSEVRHADRVIAMDEKPAQALRRGKGSSLWNAVEAIRDGEAHAAVSAGNTGALMAISKLILRMAGGPRPPGAWWPAGRRLRGVTAVLDVGANVDQRRRAAGRVRHHGRGLPRAVHGVANRARPSAC